MESGSSSEISHPGESSLPKFRKLGFSSKPQQGAVYGNEGVAWKYNCATRIIPTFADSFLKKRKKHRLLGLKQMSLNLCVKNAPEQ